jgi:hypothetical protein
MLKYCCARRVAVIFREPLIEAQFYTGLTEVLDDGSMATWEYHSQKIVINLARYNCGIEIAC